MNDDLLYSDNPNDDSEPRAAFVIRDAEASEDWTRDGRLVIAMPVQPDGTVTMTYELAAYLMTGAGWRRRGEQ